MRFAGIWGGCLSASVQKGIYGFQIEIVGNTVLLLYVTLVFLCVPICTCKQVFVGISLHVQTLSFAYERYENKIPSGLIFWRIIENSSFFFFFFSLIQLNKASKRTTSIGFLSVLSIMLTIANSKLCRHYTGTKEIIPGLLFQKTLNLLLKSCHMWFALFDT